VKIRQTIAALAFALAPLGVNGAYAATITYSINQIIGPGSVIGTITTDGTIGTLSAVNIVGFNLTLNDGSNAVNLISPNASVFVNKNAGSSLGTPGGVDLTASAISLMFNYSGSDSGDFIIASSVSELCYTAVSNCWGPTGVGLYNVNGDGQSVYIAQTGNQIIGNAIPEPATWALMLVGFGAMGLTIRGRRRRMIAQPA
jgi:hypothetical protein